MYFAQQIESNLRYVLDSAAYYGEIDEVELTKREKGKYGSVTEMLESANYGRLLYALKDKVNLPSPKHWEVLETALHDRNFLAHTFLIEFDYDHLTTAKERDVVAVLGTMSLRLRVALQMVRALRKSLDAKTDEIDKRLEQLLIELGVDDTVLKKGEVRNKRG